MSAIELMARANFNNVAKPFHALNVARRMAPGALKFASGIRRGEIKLLGARPPRTRFNGVVSAHRVIEGVSFDLSNIKKIRQRIPDVTVNDVMLAVVGGGIRKYLDAKDETPAESLIAMVPVSVRSTDEKGALGNQVSALSVPLGTHISDPLARLHYTHETAMNQKAMSNAVGAREMSEASKLAPAMITGVATRLYSRLGLANRLSPMFNTVVTNVPGPQVPLYMAGAQMTASYGIGPLMDSVGLFHAVTSYCGEINITVTACRKMLPDPDFYAQCLQESYDDLFAAATSPRKTKKRKRDKDSDEASVSEGAAAASENSATPAFDDLTAINGIGKTLAKKLHKAGVKTFADIVGLSAAEAAQLDEQLKLRGRMFRDGWIAQAAALLESQNPMGTPSDTSSSIH